MADADDKDDGKPPEDDRNPEDKAGNDKAKDDKAKGDDKAKDDKAGDDKPKDDDGDDDDGGDDEGDGDDADKDDDKPPKKSLLQRPKLLIGIGVALVVLIVGGVLWWLHARQYESTDDAYVDGHIVRLAPQVSGILTSVLVDDNMIVGPGQLLAVVDTRTSSARLQQSQAQVEQAKAGVAQALAQVEVNRRAVATAQANIREPQANLDKAEADLARYRALQRIEPTAVAGQQIDTAVANVRTARAQRDAAVRQLGEARAQVKSAQTQIGAQRAQVSAATAQVRAQGVDVANSRITAPIFGHIANRNVEVGSYVTPGQQIMAIVPLKLWITANFKETQLSLMRVGQPVDIRVDTLPDIKFHGHVASFQRGAGQAFGLLPAENATGNFVKVVQRVPVRIDIDNTDLRSYPIGPGMSVVPTVKVR